MDFYKVLEEHPYEGTGETFNPYAGKRDGKWIEGTISIDFLNTHFGEFDNATEMIAKAQSYNLEGTVLYFEWLVEHGKLQM